MPVTADKPESVLFTWGVALAISFVITMAITSLVTLGGLTVAGVLTGLSAVTRVGLEQLLRR